MAKVEQPVIPITTPNRSFESHKGTVNTVATFPDGRRVVAGSSDETLAIWNLKYGVILKTLVGHRAGVRAVAISRDGRLIASADEKGELFAWHGDTGECLTQAIKVSNVKAICSLDFSPDGAVLVIASEEKTVELWSTQTWQLQGSLIGRGSTIFCMQFSPSGELLAIGTFGEIEIWDFRTRECIANFGHTASRTLLTWTPDGTRLLSAGNGDHPTIHEWDTSTWKQVGGPWTDPHTGPIHTLAVNSTGPDTLVASASYDGHVRLWRLVDRRTIAVFKHSNSVWCMTFSLDGKYILSGGQDGKISEWAVPKDMAPAEILSINTTVRNACIIGDLSTAEELLTREIEADRNNHNSYANRSFISSRKCDWDRALHDALRSVNIQPSLTGHISHGIALCGKMLLQDAMEAFDLAFMFMNGDSRTIYLVRLIKAIAIFNASRHEEAMLLIQELAAYPDADTLACRVVQAYLYVELGTNALDDARHDEASRHFTAAINTGAFLSERKIQSRYEIFVVLFGWDLKSLWGTANQKRCHALLRAGRLAEASEVYQYMIDMGDEITKTTYRDWYIAFQQECCALYTSNGDDALAVKDYDKSIELYSAAIDLDSTNDSIFAKRCTAKLGKMLWEDALIDVQKVIELNPSSYLGYELKHAALLGARQYDDAAAVFEIMQSKLNNAPDTKLRQENITLSEAESAIQAVIDALLHNTPYRLLNTLTWGLYDRKARIDAFKTSVDYKELLSSTTKHTDLRRGRIEQAVEMHFRYVMLSHRWEENEPLLHDIHARDIYGKKKFGSGGGITKLKSFCKTARDAGYRWAWVDTCCVDKSNNLELQESVNSMFAWYRHAALTIVYLSDVPPSSKSGVLAMSVWNKRGWTVQEFLASKVVLFYQQDWTPYLDDRSPNHKNSAAIMRELEDATGIDPRALVDFHPGMSNAREKLQWASMRMTTVEEDMAYSLFGIFGVHLPVIYGEREQNALGRLLQEIVAQSGDITALDWVGRSSEFNSCLPANITSYAMPAWTLPFPPENEIHAAAFSLRNTATAGLASALYTALHNIPAPRFPHRRLHLPCIVFPVTEIRRRRSQDHATYEVLAQGLTDQLITTDIRLVLFSPSRPTRKVFLLVRPWDRSFLDFPDLSDTASVDDRSPPASPSHDSLGKSLGENENSESYQQALRLIVRLGQPFSAFLLAQQRGGEYKRIASDRSIIAQVKDMASIRDMMDVRTLEIL